MQSTIKRARALARMVRYSTGHEEYGENEYGKQARLTSDEYRNNLASWQVPAIQKHCGDLTGKVFIDIGAGDIILGEHQDKIGFPAIFYAQDLSRPSLQAGISRIAKAGIATDHIVPLASGNFDFSAIEDASIDFAFSNSLFSHLSINSILLCFAHLAPKMKPDARYFTSMIVVPHDAEYEPYDWGPVGAGKTRLVSHSTRDPFHYSENSIHLLKAYETGFEAVTVHPYGHPFQKLVEFRKV